MGIKDPLQRLKTVHESLQVFKDSPIVVVQNIFESIVGNRLPWKVRTDVVDSIVVHQIDHHRLCNPQASLMNMMGVGMYAVLGGEWCR